MMSMKGDGKPISFIEDCAVRLEDLPDYTDRLNSVFERHGTTGTWVRARVGGMPARAGRSSTSRTRRTCARCGPSRRKRSRWYASIEARTPGSTATDWCARSSTRRCSARSGRGVRRGQGCVRPAGRLNPGKIVRPPRMDDRSTLSLSAGLSNPGDRYRPRLVRVARNSLARSRCATTTARAASSSLA